MGNNITIDLDMDSSKLQRQLRAIARHTEALAEELRQVDEEVCHYCGSADVEVARAYGDGKGYELSIDCQ